MKRSKIETQLYKKLIEAVAENGAPCQKDPERWSGATLPEEDVVGWCNGCPIACFARCEHYAKFSRQPWGVWANRVHGREEEENND